MRFVSWNMNRLGRSAANHVKAWEYLRDELKADSALVQEASPTDNLVRASTSRSTRNATTGARRWSRSVQLPFFEDVRGFVYLSGQRRGSDGDAARRWRPR